MTSLKYLEKAMRNFEIQYGVGVTANVKWIIIEATRLEKEDKERLRRLRNGR